MGNHISSFFDIPKDVIPTTTAITSERAKHSQKEELEFRPLRVAIIGGGLGGLSAAVALRRAGHQGKGTVEPKVFFVG